METNLSSHKGRHHISTRRETKYQDSMNTPDQFTASGDSQALNLKFALSAENQRTYGATHAAKF